MSLGPMSLSEANAGVQHLLTSEAPTYGVVDHGVIASDAREAGKLTCALHLSGVFIECQQFH